MTHSSLLPQHPLSGTSGLSAGPDAIDAGLLTQLANDLFRDPPPNPAPQLPPSEPGAPTPDYYFLEPAPAAATGSPWNQAPAPFGLDTFQPELVPSLDPAPGPFDVHTVRRDFPILAERIHGKPLVWLDNAATTQKPNAVIDRIAAFYRHENSNIHRAAHDLAARSTDAYEGAREKVRRFLNAPSVQDIVFVRGATEAINLVAQSWGRRFIGPGDEIVITWLEHHSNIVPWQQLAAEKGARLRVAPIDERGEVILEEYEKLLNSRTRLVSLTHVSNALGTINPVKDLTALAHRHGAKVLVDGAQAVSHLQADVQDIDADFYVFSGHKVFGPTGIGVLYGRSEILNATPPWQGGGNMIADVTFERTVYHAAPARFEAGTGNIADAVGLGAALDYLSRLGLENVQRHEHELLVYGTEALSRIPGLRIIGTAREKAGVLSFVLEGHRPEEVGAALNREGIAVRSGHHCAQPALRRFGLEASVRPSLALYNTRSDLDALVAAVQQLQKGHPRY
ncbi:family 2A encapsulin nanocompartment cargo protein cysteine desulfurase [Geothrix sp. PMB-07]|uniref:family 2A encapsulin nanocompartment cargo protein cysteine desulfurase n=1 Tax=Geothrix sp. PMB-07 TaxID=3068640 RepID=UPI0027405AC3|nr:family 2A encapsulin nanocompartment cargo protein cysteine desulfurase [Geothrix sp. PMB-07]WLT33481.1 family 2A encapsulin nanocompartment cargo protein cysteine desulfurase [Geothrix sp. PMB-07]